MLSRPESREESTASVYDRAAESWRRTEPILLSDFTARPFLLDWCAPVDGLRVLDLGCGEGYVSRELESRGAAAVQGIDVSAEMIVRAKQQAGSSGRLSFEVGDASRLDHLPDACVDLAVAVFLFNYVDRATMASIMAEVVRVVRPGGRFVFSVPHPSLAFQRPEEAPFYFRRGGAGYFGGRDAQFEGRIWRRDGESVPVRCIHKTFDDYFAALRVAGVQGLPEVRELHVTDEHVAFDPEFFGPLVETPLHLAFRLEL